MSPSPNVHCRKGRSTAAGPGHPGRWFAGFASVLGLAVGAVAQPAQPGETTATLGAALVREGDASLDGGGNFRWTGLNASFRVSRQFTDALAAGVTARLATEAWSFSTPNAFGGAAPWTDIDRPSVGLTFNYTPRIDRAIFVNPQLEWSYERGARTSDAVSYGAVLGALQAFSPTRFVGLGLGAFRQIDEYRFFPIVLVNWQLDERWRLSNPLPAGPAGGAGLELGYTLAPGWELAAGAAYREYRFRLRDDGPAPDGLGINRGIPAFARLTWRPAPAMRVDLYAGAVTDGALKVKDSSGNEVQRSSYGASTLFALNGSISF